MPRDGKLEGGFLRGYQRSAGPTASEFVGKTMGMLLRTAVQTVVVVIVLRLLGVL